MADPKWYDSMTQKGLALCYNCPTPPTPPTPHLLSMWFLDVKQLVGR